MTDDRDNSKVTDTAELLKSAWSAVEAAGIPESLHAVAFKQAVGLISGPRLGLESPRAAQRSRTRTDNNAEDSKGGSVSLGETQSLIRDEEAFFASFAGESKVDEEQLRRVYFVKDGRPRIALTKSKLGSTEAERNRAVATLLAGLRWYVEGKASVYVGEVRTAAESIPYEVSRNLATHLDGVPGTVPVGVKKDKAVRVQTGKFDEPFAMLIEKLTAS